MTRQHLHRLTTLHRRKGRDAHGLFLVEGVRSVGAALAAGARLHEVVVCETASPAATALAATALAAGVPVEAVPSHALDRLSDAETAQGIVAVASRIVLEALPDGVQRVLVLDGVQDPGNVGAAVRTAAWFGAQAIVADARTADFEGPKAVRAAMGGLWDVPLVRVPHLEPVLDQLAAAGVTLWGAALDGEPVDAWQPGAASALVLGSEAHGLSDAVRTRLSGQVTIPTERALGASRGVESLNVSVAAGILLHAWALSARRLPG